MVVLVELYKIGPMRYIRQGDTATVCLIHTGRDTGRVDFLVGVTLPVNSV